jgi:DNA end-binding protein Ku
MEDEGRVGIGAVVMRNKQYLAAIRPLDGALAMSTMRFADEVVPKSEIPGLPRRSKADAKEVKLAKQIIDALATDWDPKKYKDTYTDELRAVIRKKAKGETIVNEEESEEPTAKVVDLMAALQRSVEEAKSGRRKPAKKAAKRTAKKAPARKTAAKRRAS